MSGSIHHSCMPRGRSVPVSTMENDGQKFVLTFFGAGRSQSETGLTTSYSRLTTDGFLANDRLCLVADIVFVQGPCTQIDVLQKGLVSAIDYGALEDLSADMGKMRDLNPDVTFQVGSQRLYAHRALLCTRSNYFRSQFEEQAAPPYFVIPDTEFGTVDNFLEFLYTGKMSTEVLQSIESLCDLHKLACEYQVASLKDKCASAIHEIFSPRTVVRALLHNRDAGDHCNAIRQGALQYIEIQHMPTRKRVCVCVCAPISLAFTCMSPSLLHRCGGPVLPTVRVCCCVCLKSLPLALSFEPWFLV